ncbi:MAG: elongation factor G [Clostridia bacterium]|nr:elongation factor G [Clostridia bacterium]
MKDYKTDKIKNLALLGHGSCGKTSLAEAMLYVAGATDRHGKVADGNTVMDFDSEEKKRGVSCFSAVSSLEWRERKINLIDAPGFFDFANGQAEAIRAAKNAIIVLSAKSGLNVGSQKAYKACQKHGVSTIFFVSKADSEHANCKDVIAGLKVAYGSKIMPVIIPYASDRKVECYINVVTGRTWEYKDGKAIEISMPDAAKERYEQMYGLLCESVASLNEEMMEKYFSGETFTEDELFAGLREGVKTGEISPVYCGAAQTLEGIDLFLNALVKILPNATQVGGEIGIDGNGEMVEVKCDPEGTLAATVFKTVADPFVGKMSFFKVISGELKSGDTVYNSRTGETEKVGKLMYVRGGKQEDVVKITAGDIGAAAKMNNVKTGDTLCDPKHIVTLSGVDFPKASISMAIKPVKKGEEDKIAAAMVKICEENPSVEFTNNLETKQQVVSGLGEQNLDVIVSLLKNKFGVEVTLEAPKVAYRETIKKKVKVQGRHKKQSGGHGQFGDVWIEFEPTEGEDLVFEEKIFGGSVPKNYFPAVEKGLQDSIKKGVLAGYPVVGLKATLVDGSYHPVDSSEMAFKTAAAIAYKTGLEQANPVLLEPVGTLKAIVPEDNMGDIIGDINKRRGRVLGMNPLEDKEQEIVAEVPIAETSDFSTVLRSVTQGRGSFTLEFERYEEAPPMVAQKVVEEAKASGKVE